jgi:very-short-patch-repair endonuclease
MRNSTISHRHSLLSARAAAMRAAPTASEGRLWRELVNRKLGVSFRRQVVIAGYIVDFVAASRKLIVEVDGAYHAQRGAADGRRDAVLKRLGFLVLRLDVELVMRDLAGALRLIAKHL